MLDRYGPCLRKYLAAWQASGASDNESFWRWLDCRTPPPDLDRSSHICAVQRQIACTNPSDTALAELHQQLRTLEREHCPRERLERDVVRYLEPEEAQRFRIRIEGGVWKTASGERLSTGPDGFIFVLSLHDELYANEKQTEPPRFQHTSFLCGAPVKAAGKIVVCDGRLTMCSPYSGCVVALVMAAALLPIASSERRLMQALPPVQS